MKLLSSLLRVLSSIFSSNKAFEAMYEERSLARAVPRRRNGSAIAVASVLFIGLMAFILVVTWQRADESVFIQTHKNLHNITLSEMNFRVSTISTASCSPAASCRIMLLAQGLTNLDILKDDPVRDSRASMRANSTILLRMDIPTETVIQAATTKDYAVVGLPPMHFDRVTAFVEGIQSNTQLYGGMVGIPLSLAETKPEFKKNLTVDLLIDLYPGQPGLFRLGAKPLFFVTNPPQYSAYLKIINMNDNLKKNWLSDLSRIVMAVFLLLLFLMIDSSAETLGMALFLGFECFASTLDYGWLNIGDSTPYFVSAYSMSAIFKLYFALQLARVIKPNVTPWVVSSIAITAVFTVVHKYLPDAQKESIPAARDLAINGFAMLLCFRAAFHLLPKKIYWRTSALLIAAFAFFQQSLYPVEILFYPDLGYWDGWNDFYYFMRSSSPYLLAMSAFVNISSLENRVRNLAKVEAKNQLVEDELRLASEVQQALTYVSTIPEDFSLSFHQESQLSISGDCYHIHWDSNRERLIIILNDITGHGIQAALKASSCQAIASMVMDQPDFDGKLGQRLIRYEQELLNFFTRGNSDQQLFSFVGAEFDPRSRKVALYRVNFTFPLLVKKTASDESLAHWQVEQLHTPNRSIQQWDLEPGMAFILLSDGFVASSRSSLFLTRELQAGFAHGSEKLNSEDLKTKVLAASEKQSVVVDDDKTLVICQWQPKAKSKALKESA